jgi:hypothetical protein
MLIFFFCTELLFSVVDLLIILNKTPKFTGDHRAGNRIRRALFVYGFRLLLMVGR